MDMTKYLVLSVKEIMKIHKSTIAPPLKSKKSIKVFLEAKVTFSDCFDFLICSRLRLEKPTCPDQKPIT